MLSYYNIATWLRGIKAWLIILKSKIRLTDLTVLRHENFDRKQMWQNMTIANRLLKLGQIADNIKQIDNI